MKCVKTGDLARPGPHHHHRYLKWGGLGMHGVVVDEHLQKGPTLPQRLLVLWADYKGVIEYEDELVLVQEGKGNV